MTITIPYYLIGISAVVKQPTRASPHTHRLIQARHPIQPNPTQRNTTKSLHVHCEQCRPPPHLPNTTKCCKCIICKWHRPIPPTTHPSRLRQPLKPTRTSIRLNATISPYTYRVRYTSIPPSTHQSIAINHEPT